MARSDKCTTLCRFVLILVIFACAASAASAQTDGHLSQSNATGKIPFGSYQLSGIDNVNLGAGAVNVEIPLVGRKGRGFDEGMKLIYSSKFYSMRSTLWWNGYNYIPMYSWGTSDTNPGWKTISVNGGYIEHNYQANQCKVEQWNPPFAEYPGFWSTIALFNVWVYSHFTYVSNDGSKHLFPNRHYFNDSQYPLSQCWSGTDDWEFGTNLAVGESDSGTMELQVTPVSGQPIPVLNYEVRYKNGGRLVNGSIRLDSNGNQPPGLRRVSQFVTNPNGTQTLSYYNSNGQTNNYVFHNGTVNITCPWISTHTPEGYAITGTSCGTPYSAPTLTKIVLPNSLEYQFEYSTVGGELSKIILPTGAYIRYEYQTFANFDEYSPRTSETTMIDSRRLTRRCEKPDSEPERCWQYEYPSRTVTKVTDPLGQVTVHTFMQDGLHEQKTEIFNAAGTLVRKVENEWAWTVGAVQGDGAFECPQRTCGTGFFKTDKRNWRITKTTATLIDTNQVSVVQTAYDSYMNVTTKSEHDFGIGTQGPLLRQTVFTYLHTGNAAYLNKHILDRPATKKIYDGASNLKAQSEFLYDTTSLSVSGGAILHDYTNYPTTFLTRGNLTESKVWRNTDGAWLLTKNWYDELGNLIQTQDPLQHNTFYFYDDSWTTLTGGSSCPPSGGSEKAYVTKVKNHLNHEVLTKYYSCSALSGSVTDVNNQQTTFTYDFFDRPLIETRPSGGGSTTWAWSDSVKKATSSAEIGSGVSPLTNEFNYDGFGRTVLAILTSDPDGPTKTATEYDELGRVKYSWNPTRCSDAKTNCGEPTWGLSENKYDVLNRVTRVKPPDGSLNPEVNIIATEYFGNRTTVVDQAGKMRRSFTDGLGRLIEVHEPTGGSSSPTPGTGSAAASGSLQNFSGSGPTPGTGSSTVNGALQTIPGTTAAPGTGDVLITGSLESYSEYEQVGEECVLYYTEGGCAQWEPIYQWVTYYNTGGAAILVNGQTKTAYFNLYLNNTAAALATALANAINADSNYPVTASVAGTTINLTSKVTGTASNYPLVVSSWTDDPQHFGGPSFWLDRSGPTLTGGQNTTSTVYDSGSTWVTVNGFQASVSYGQGSTTATVASAIANILNTNGSSPVTASVNGSALNLTAKTTGPATNYSLSAGSSTNQSASFPFGSFTVSVSGATLTGGHDTIPPTTDSGTAWVTVNGFQAQVTYGSGSTATSVASALANILNTNGSSPVTASLAGSSLTLTAKTSGLATNYSLSTGASTNYPSIFSQPSFPVAPSGTTLTGGTNGSQGSFTAPAVTKYVYDTLDNLTCVEQQGNVSSTGCAANPSNDATSPWRVRRFTYNSLSQLLTAKNPESGLINYTYDNDGNVTTKASPAPNQISTATVTITYAYDELHRLKKKTYSDSTPTVKFAYDGVTFESCSTPLSTANAKGRRTAMCDGSGSEAWSYDEMGRVKIDRRTISGVTKDFTYDYYLNSSVWKITYPTNPTRTIEYKTTSAGRTEWAKDVANSINYATYAKYSPAGALCSLKNGASITSTFTFTNRLQPNRLHVTSNTTTWNACDPPTQNGNIQDFTYAFNHGSANNGNVVQIANAITPGRTQSFTYDELNRIQTAKTQATAGQQHCWGETFSYNIWANLLTIGGISPDYNGCTQESLNVTATNKNQLGGHCYDAAGNLALNAACPQPPTPLNPIYVYDAENRMTSTAGVNYFYDGDGKRVKKDQTSGSTYDKLYWYGLSADPMMESDLSGTVTDEYIFFGGKRTARRKSDATIHYYFADHLGSSRVVTSTAGAILEDSDYYPFGGERVVTDTTNNNYKFTDKERDSESGLDFFIARYYSASMGRYLSADWSASPSPVPYADFANPQSLNLYAYVGNNPLNATDPDGHCCAYSASSISDLVDPGVNKAVEYVRDKAVSSGNTGAAGVATFLAGAAGDVIKGFSNLLRTGESVASLREGASVGEVATAVAEEGGRIGGTMLAVIAAGAPRPTPNSVGAQGEAAVAGQIQAAGGQVLGRNVTLDTAAGRTRPDIYARTPAGGTEFVEVKTGPTARLSGNQAAAFPQVAAGGAIPRGANAARAGLVPGQPMPPTPVRVVNTPRPAEPSPPLPVPRRNERRP